LANSFERGCIAFSNSLSNLAQAFLMTSALQPVQCKSLAGVRLRKHADYVRAYAAARKRQSPSMSWFLAPQSPDCPSVSSAARVGLTVGKVIGKAHERNRIKRRMREALRRHVNLLPVGFDLIFHPRRSVLTIEFAQLEAEIVRILQQASADAVRPTKRPAPAAPAS
jgi:ribonuclease P protein component